MIMILLIKFGSFKQRFKAIAMLVLVTSLFGLKPISAQTSITTGIPSAASSLSGTTVGLSFALKNNNSSPITLTGIDFYMGTANGAQTWTLWYSATSLSGNGSISSPTFTQIASVTAAAPTATAIIPLFTTLSFSVPANTTYRFVITSTGGSINYGGAATIGNIFSNGGVDLLRGDYQIAGGNVGWAASSYSFNISPRFFGGTVYFTSGSGPSCTSAPSTPVITTAPMNAPLCPLGTTTLTATVATPPPTVKYQWEQSAASSGPWVNSVGGTGDTSLSYTTPGLTASRWYRLKASCDTFSSTSTPYQVTVSPFPTVSILASAPNPVCPNTVITFTALPANTGASPTYQWTKNGINVGTNSTTYTNNSWANGDIVSVVLSAPNSCQTASPVSPTSPITLSVGTPLSNPGAIVGPVNPCPSGSATYTVPAVSGASTYNWTLPSGWSITSGVGTNTIIVATTGAAGNVAVTAGNTCGSNTAASSLAVVPSATVLAPDPIAGNASPCVGSTQTYNVTAVPGLTYNWTLPAGWVITSGGTSNQITVTTNGTAGTISVKGISPCGSSLPTTFAVIPAPNLPPSVAASVSTPGNIACTGDPVTFTAMPVNGGPLPQYQWLKNGLPVGTNAATFTTSSLVTGDVISVNLTSNSPCITGSGTVSSTGIVMTIKPSVVPGINVNTNPAPALCAGASIMFVSNSVGGGFTPAYQWYRNGAPIGGATAPTFSTATLSNGDTFTVRLTSSELCSTIPQATSNKVGITVNQSVTPSVSLSVNPGTTIQSGQTVIFTANFNGGGAAPSFQWYKNGLAVAGATGSSYTTDNLRSGDQVRVYLTSNAPCATIATVVSQAVTLSIPTSIDVQKGDNQFQVFPNPNTGSFAVMADWANLNKAPIRVSLINSLGVTVYSRVIATGKQTGSLQINVAPGVANGVYQLVLNTTEQRMVKTVLVQR